MLNEQDVEEVKKLCAESSAIGAMIERISLVAYINANARMFRRLKGAEVAVEILRWVEQRHEDKCPAQVPASASEAIEQAIEASKAVGQC